VGAGRSPGLRGRRPPLGSGIALIRIRPYYPSVHYISQATIEFTMPFPTRSAIEPLPLSGEALPEGAGTVSPFDVLLHLGGSEAELVSEVLEQHTQPIAGQPRERVATFADGRLLERDEGRRSSPARRPTLDRNAAPPYRARHGWQRQ
jgi:hypothetical protein